MSERLFENESAEDSKLGKLCLKVSKHLLGHPEDSTAILKAVTVGLENYARAQTDSRDLVAREAILSLISDRKETPAFPIYGEIAVAHYQFPSGLTGHSPVEEKFWDKFIDAVSAKSLDELTAFVRKRRGNDCYVWWLSYVVPAVIAPEIENRNEQNRR